MWKALQRWYLASRVRHLRGRVDAHSRWVEAQQLEFEDLVRELRALESKQYQLKYPTFAKRSVSKVYGA